MAVAERMARTLAGHLGPGCFLWTRGASAGVLQRFGDGARPRARWAARWLAALCLVLPLLLPYGAHSSAQQQIPLEQQVEVLLDPQGKLDIHEVSKPEMEPRFSRLSNDRSLGYREGAVWLRLRLSRPPTTPSTWWLDLGVPWLDEAQLFEPQADGGYQARAKVGANHPFEQRDVNYRMPIYSVELKDTPQTYYLRLQGDNTMLIAPRLWAPPGFVLHYGREQMALGMLVGAHVLLFLSALWFGVAIREKAYYILALAIVSNLVQLLGTEGLAYQWFTPGWPGSTDVFMVLGWYLVMPLCGLFVLSYARLWRRGGWVWLYVASTWGFSLVAIPLSLNGHFREVTPLVQVWTLLFLASNVALMGYYGRQGNRRAQLLCWAFCVLLLGVLLRVGRNLGWLSENVVTNDGYHLGIFLFMMVIQYAAIRDLRQMRRQMELSQQDRWRMARQAEQRLEAEVRSRTAQLNEALQMVQSTLAVERRAREDQRQFFATVSHELRTPLAVIDAAAMNLELDLKDGDPRVLKRCRRIRAASDQLVDLVRDCFQEDRLNLADRENRREPMEPDQLLLEARDAASMAGPQHQFTVQAQEPLGPLLCDPELTRLALRTLAINAVKYTPLGTLVRLLASRAESGVVLEVSDDGPGVAADELPHLMRRYYRGRNAQSIPGTGLGLSMAREMVESQGGRLTLSSGTGQGFTARIWLPLGDPKAF